MLIIPFLLLLLFFGLLITVLIKTRVGLVERLSLSYLLGIGVFTFFVFVFNLIFNVDYGVYNTLSILAGLCIVLFIIKHKDVIEFFKGIKFEKKKPKLETIVFYIIILSVFIYTLLINLYWPISDWDALAMYDFRAKILLIDTNLIHAATSNDYFLGYPLLTSLSHLFVYQFGLSNPKFVYSLLYVSFIIIFYHSLKRYISVKKAAFFTVILALSPEIFSHAAIAYTNLAYVVYLCTGTFYLYDWLKNRELSKLLLSGILIGLSTWTRSYEPFWLAPLFIVFLNVFKNRKWKDVASYLLVILTFYLPWKFFMSFVNKSLGSPSSSVVPSYLMLLKSVSLERIALVGSYLYQYVFSTWGLLFLLFVGTMLIVLLSKRTNKIFLYITILFFAILFIGTYFFFIVYPEWQSIPDSARRMSMFLIPLMLYSIALAINDDKKQRKI